MSEGVGSVSICVDGGAESVPIVMQIDSASSASAQDPGQDFTFSGQDEVTLDPNGTACFTFGIVDDMLDENSEDVLVIFTEGNDTNATFSLEASIRILDNDFSEEGGREGGGGGKEGGRVGAQCK